MILETKRLCLREMTIDDYPALCAILQDEQTMWAYEHAFSDAEAMQWLKRQMENYRVNGFGLWVVLLKENKTMIGQCGITKQMWNEKEVPEIGYLFNRAYWHCGYATEAAIACKEYAFKTLGIPEVYSIIRDSNFPSQHVAQRNGMTVKGKFVKNYYNVDMPHLVYSVQREE